MHQITRSPWSSLTPAQERALEEARTLPEFGGLQAAEAYRAISVEFALRTARLLSSNDLRGALDAASISTVADQIAAARDASMTDAIERLQSIADGTAGVNPKVRRFVTRAMPTLASGE